MQVTRLARAAVARRAAAARGTTQLHGVEQGVETAREQLGRLGGTPFELGQVTLDVADPVMVPKSVLNDLRRQAVELTEVIIAPRSPTIGQTLKDLHFRDKYGLTTVAIWRNGRSHRTDVGTMALESGDALLMVGLPQRTQLLAQEPGYIVLEGPRAPATMQPGRGPLSALIVIVTILVSALGWVPTPEAMLAGAVALVLSGSISGSMNEIHLKRVAGRPAPIAMRFDIIV